MWMRHRGYAGARTGGGGSDGGIDVTSRTALAQVKFEAAAVGRPALPRLVGARGRRDHQLLLVTGAGYSRQAQTYADQMDVALSTCTLTGSTAPASTTPRSRRGGGGPPERAPRHPVTPDRAGPERGRGQRGPREPRPSADLGLSPGRAERRGHLSRCGLRQQLLDDASQLLRPDRQQWRSGYSHDRTA